MKPWSYRRGLALVGALACAACDASDLDAVQPMPDAANTRATDASAAHDDAAEPSARDGALAEPDGAPPDAQEVVRDLGATSMEAGAPARPVRCEGDCVPTGEVLDVYPLDPRCFSPHVGATTANTIFVACTVSLPGDNRTEARLWALDDEAAELWTVARNGPDHDRASAKALSVTLDGSVLLAGDGDTPPPFTGESWDNHGFVNLYAPGGDLLEDDVVELGARTHPMALSVNGDGDILLAGNVDADLFVRRYDAQLRPRWTATMTSVGGSTLEAASVATTPDARVLVAGHDEETFSNWRSFVAQLEGDGALRWRHMHDGPEGRDMFEHVAARHDGVTLLAGADQLVEEETRAALIAIDAEGAELWRWHAPELTPKAVLVDDDRAIVLLSGPGPAYPLTIAAIASDGSTLWQRELDGLGAISPGFSWAPAGELLVAGSHRPDGSTWETYLARVAY